MQDLARPLSDCSNLEQLAAHTETTKRTSADRNSSYETCSSEAHENDGVKRARHCYGYVFALLHGKSSNHSWWMGELAEHIIRIGRTPMVRTLIHSTSWMKQRLPDLIKMVANRTELKVSLSSLWRRVLDSFAEIWSFWFPYSRYTGSTSATWRQKVLCSLLGRGQADMRWDVEGRPLREAS